MSDPPISEGPRKRLEPSTQPSQENSLDGIKSEPVDTTNFLLDNLGYYLMIGLSGGPRLFPSRYLINLQKGATFFWVAGLMYYFQNFSLGAYLYLALHGSYGFLWILKDVTFGDKIFLDKVTIGEAIATVAFSTLYWIPSYLLISRSSQAGEHPSEARVFYSIITYVAGTFCVLCADAEKHCLLKYKLLVPRAILDEGLFARNRNPKYFGQMLIYGSFAMVSANDISWLILIPIWLTLFNLKMYCKDLYLRKNDGWPDYNRKTYKFLFKVFKSHFMNVFFYFFITVFCYFAYTYEGLFIFLKR